MSFTDFSGDDSLGADLSSLGPLVTTLETALVAIFPSLRNIAGFFADVTIEEQHIDRLRITEHPVEQGAAITDHSYKMPAQVTVRAGWSNSSLRSGGNPFYIQMIYASLLAVQASRQPIPVVTGKRAYANMLIESLIETTDKEHENAMVLVVECREIIIVATQTVSVPPAANMANPSLTAATQNNGTVAPIANPSSYNSAAYSP